MRGPASSIPQGVAGKASAIAAAAPPLAAAEMNDKNSPLVRVWRLA